MFQQFEQGCDGLRPRISNASNRSTPLEAMYGRNHFDHRRNSIAPKVRYCPGCLFRNHRRIRLTEICQPLRERPPQVARYGVGMALGAFS